MVILGNGGVGKSSLMNRFVNNEFDAQSFHTIGVEFLNKDLSIDGDTYTMQIWDTAGQEVLTTLATLPHATLLSAPPFPPPLSPHSHLFSS